MYVPLAYDKYLWLTSIVDLYIYFLSSSCDSTWFGASFARDFLSDLHEFHVENITQSLVLVYDIQLNMS